MRRKPTYEELEQEIKELKRDALEHRKSRNQLRRNEGPFRDLAEKLPIPAAIAARDMNTIYLNPKFTEVFGFRIEDIPNRQAWHVRFFKDSEYRRKIAQEVDQWIKSGAESTIFKRKYTDKWAQDHDVMVHMFHIKNRYYIFIEDITEITRSEKDLIKGYSVLEKRVAERTEALTRINLKLKREIEERKQAEIERQKLQAQLQQIQKLEAVSTLAGGLAHRFNNTLSVIAGNLELVKMEFPDNEIIDEYAEPMQKSIHHLAQLTGQMLAFARGGKYKAKSISLSDFIRNTLPLLKHIVKPGIAVETDLPFDISHVDADLSQMQMVLSALLQNASEAIEERGRIRLICSDEEITPSGADAFPGLTPGTYVRLCIQDDGKGMDEVTARRVFEPFFSTKFHGRGLGLAAVYGIVKNHDGFIFMDSSPDSGTMASIYLPAKSKAETPRTIESGDVNRNRTILLIEDEKQVLAVNRALLERLGYQVVSAETGQKAVDLARAFEGKIDIALLDIVLPDMDGKEIYPLICAARPDMKVVVCSGYALDGPVQDILDAGAQAFIQKPFSLKTLSEKLKDVI